MLIILIGLITAVLFVYLHYVSNKKKGKIPFANVPEDELEILELSFMEKEGSILNSRSVSSITLYNGDITAKFSIEKQVLSTLQANPWLAGRLIRHQFPGKRKKEIALKYPRQFSEKNLNDYYQEKWIPSSELNDKMSLEQISQVTNPYLCKSGKDSIDNNEILFKTIIFKIYDDNTTDSTTISTRKVVQTAIIFTMNHVIGDGHTFYRLYAFLDGRVPIESLIIQRDTAFPVNINKERGEFYQKITKSWKLIAVLIFRRLFLSKPISAKVFLVNNALLNEKKKEYLSTVTEKTESTSIPSEGGYSEKANIISANDILTSLFFNKMKVAFGVMAINFRFRKEAYTNNHAGNYEAVIVYGREDYQSPIGIRKALLNNYTAANTKFPEDWSTVVQFSPTLVTNWSSFYVHLQFPGTNAHIYHLPLFLTKYAPSDICVIFKKDQDQLAVIPLIPDRNILRNFAEPFLVEDPILSPQF